MTKLKLIGLASALALGSASSHAADVDVSAGAKIIAPLQLTNTTALYFGTIVPSINSDDTVIVAHTGAKTCGNSLTCLSDDHTAAQFSVAGATQNTYSIQLPSTVAITSGNNSMTIKDFSGSKATGTLTGGQDNFAVGGTLEVAANQAAGEYTGTFVVSVEYQ